MTNIELRNASEWEQGVRKETGTPRKPLHPHPDGYKEAGDDGKDHKFGKSYKKKERVIPCKQAGNLCLVQQIVPSVREMWD
jgi:hypothetical protein